MTTPRFSRSTLAAGAAAVGALGAIGIAQLAGGSNPVMQFTQAAASDSTSTTVAGQAPTRPARPAKLDADTEAKVKEAAVAAVPGATYDHGHKEGEGYRALLTKADGTRVLVHEDSAFKVTSVEDPAPARGPGGRGHGDRAPLDADTAAKVKAAALEAVPGATYEHGHKEADGGYDAILTKADGTKVRVLEDANFKVTSVEDPAPMRGPGGPGGRGHGGPRPDGAPEGAAA